MAIGKFPTRTKMLDLFAILTKGGLVLWCLERTPFSSTLSSVNSLIRDVILQVRRLYDFLPFIRSTIVDRTVCDARRCTVGVLASSVQFHVYCNHGCFPFTPPPPPHTHHRSGVALSTSTSPSNSITSWTTSLSWFL